VELQPAIYAWREIDPGVTISNADYDDAGIIARFVVGGRATPNADGTWNYEYAVYNINGDVKVLKNIAKKYGMRASHWKAQDCLWISRKNATFDK